MEAGIDREQLNALKAKLQKACQDPVKLKLIVSAVIIVFGFFFYCSPQAGRLAEARTKYGKAAEKARLAKESRHVVKQGKTFLDRLPKLEDVSDWQEYVMQRVDEAGAKLRKIEPRRGLMKGKYRIIVLEIEAEGMFEQIVDFVDRLERGERIVRLDRLQLEKRADRMSFRFVLMGLAKLRA
ncbi:MAG: type 4a pilus biogenesis protein PilO [Planctomycetota bacterium]|nr:type 4a pilus biogenesis protein PilO [Planctomycetota bacterium]